MRKTGEHGKKQNKKKKKGKKAYFFFRNDICRAAKRDAHKKWRILFSIVPFSGDQRTSCNPTPVVRTQAAQAQRIEQIVCCVLSLYKQRSVEPFICLEPTIRGR